MPKHPILTYILPFISRAKGGLFLEEVTMILPKLPALYNPAILTSSNGSSRVLVMQNGCLKYVSRLSCKTSLIALPVLCSSMQLSTSVFTKFIVQFCLAPDKMRCPGLLVQCIFLEFSCTSQEYFGWGIGQRLIKSSVDGTNTRSISSLILEISSLISLITSFAYYSQVKSVNPLVKEVFFEFKSGPKTTTQSTLVFYFYLKCLISFITIFMPIISFESFLLKDPLTNNTLQAWVGSLKNTFCPRLSNLAPRSLIFSSLYPPSTHVTSMHAIIPTQTVPILTCIFSFPVQSSIITTPDPSSLLITLKIILLLQSLSLTLPMSNSPFSWASSLITFITSNLSSLCFNFVIKCWKLPNYLVLNPIEHLAAVLLGSNARLNSTFLDLLFIIDDAIDSASLLRTNFLSFFLEMGSYSNSSSLLDSCEYSISIISRQYIIKQAIILISQIQKNKINAVYTLFHAREPSFIEVLKNHFVFSFDFGEQNSTFRDDSSIIFFLGFTPSLIDIPTFFYLNYQGSQWLIAYSLHSTETHVMAMLIIFEFMIAQILTI